MPDARNTVLLSMALTGGIVIVADARKGEMPRPRNIFGLAFAYMGLAALADVAPSIAIPFAYLITAATALDRGTEALQGINTSLTKESPDPVTSSAGSLFTAHDTGTATGAATAAPQAGANDRRYPSAAQTIGSLVAPLQTAYRNLGGVAAHNSRAIGNWESDNAVDMAAPIGTPIYAVEDGVINSAGYNNLGGNRLHLNSNTNEYYYAHMSRLAVITGQKVRKGQIIGYVGDTGNAKGTSPHLHFASKVGNPETLIGFK